MEDLPFTPITLPTPVTISLEALQDKKSVICASIHGQPCLVVYCRCNQAGAIWMPPVGKASYWWIHMSPVTIDEFLLGCEAQGIAFTQDEILRRWVAHVTGQESQTN